MVAMSDGHFLSLMSDGNKVVTDVAPSRGPSRRTPAPLPLYSQTHSGESAAVTKSAGKMMNDFVGRRRSSQTTERLLNQRPVSLICDPFHKHLKTTGGAMNSMMDHRALRCNTWAVYA
ncbi:hypothetical protein EYF80_031880 [Liparis tanakae]|uniref:Uncharacterized protein n=1 Tax=Liparis tanakae TaxID=230148 RepID=A0A4Z2GX48_9TELE|nr:hypothetical protein EYF80_031880 [Liparis tanakae]